ncbi:hypothetical protein HK405_013913, partial [Cladochytrium tenue]
DLRSRFAEPFDEFLSALLDLLDDHATDLDDPSLRAAACIAAPRGSNWTVWVAADLRHRFLAAKSAHAGPRATHGEFVNLLLALRDRRLPDLLRLTPAAAAAPQASASSSSSRALLLVVGRRSSRRLCDQAAAAATAASATGSAATNVGLDSPSIASRRPRELSPAADAHNPPGSPARRRRRLSPDAGTGGASLAAPPYSAHADDVAALDSDSNTYLPRSAPAPTARESPAADSPPSPDALTRWLTLPPEQHDAHPSPVQSGDSCHMRNPAVWDASSAVDVNSRATELHDGRIGPRNATKAYESLPPYFLAPSLESPADLTGIQSSDTEAHTNVSDSGAARNTLLSPSVTRLLRRGQYSTDDSVAGGTAADSEPAHRIRTPASDPPPPYKPPVGTATGSSAASAAHADADVETATSHPSPLSQTSPPPHDWLAALVSAASGAPATAAANLPNPAAATAAIQGWQAAAAVAAAATAAAPASDPAFDLLPPYRPAPASSTAAAAAAAQDKPPQTSSQQTPSAAAATAPAGEVAPAATGPDASTVAFLANWDRDFRSWLTLPDPTAAAAAAPGEIPTLPPPPQQQQQQLMLPPLDVEIGDADLNSLRTRMFVALLSHGPTWGRRDSRSSGN